MKLILGDCIDKLKELDDNSIDSIVTDPPYGLSFMGKDWDKKKATQETKSQVVKGLGAGMKMTTLADNIEFEKWVTEWASECMRVLKPGGYMLAFGGSRMYHRLASGVENAGFEIRDQMMWVYGSGFPKSMNISKQIDKKPNADLKEFSKALKERRIELGLSLSEADKLITGGTTMYSFLEGRNDNDVYPPNKEYWEKIKEHFGMDEWSSIIENNLKIVGEEEGSFGYQKDGERWGETRTLTETTTDLAKQWEGWGTALKPAHEPIVMARKPISEKTIVDNVLEWGTGGINIDESRIPTDETITNHSRSSESAISKGKYGDSKEQETHQTEGQRLGRFPANIIFDEEAGKILDEQTGILNSGFMKAGTPRLMSDNPNKNTYGKWNPDTVANDTYGDSGGASRFFYCPKTSKTDRNEGLDTFEVKQTIGGGGGIGDYKDDVNSASGKFGSEKAPSKNFHPTVKPTDLMLYLIRLVTPKGGTTLDPFMGSGSTGKAAIRGGFDFVGIEREKEYMKIAEARIQYEKDNPYIEDKQTRITVNKSTEKFW